MTSMMGGMGGISGGGSSFGIPSSTIGTLGSPGGASAFNGGLSGGGSSFGIPNSTIGTLGSPGGVPAFNSSGGASSLGNIGSQLSSGPIGGGSSFLNNLASGGSFLNNITPGAIFPSHHNYSMVPNLMNQSSPGSGSSWGPSNSFNFLNNLATGLTGGPIGGGGSLLNNFTSGPGSGSTYGDGGGFLNNLANGIGNMLGSGGGFNLGSNDDGGLLGNPGYGLGGSYDGGGYGGDYGAGGGFNTGVNDDGGLMWNPTFGLGGGFDDGGGSGFWGDGGWGGGYSPGMNDDGGLLWNPTFGYSGPDDGGDIGFGLGNQNWTDAGLFLGGQYYTLGMNPTDGSFFLTPLNITSGDIPQFAPDSPGALGTDVTSLPGDRGDNTWIDNNTGPIIDSGIGNESDQGDLNRTPSGLVTGGQTFSLVMNPDGSFSLVPQPGSLEEGQSQNNSGTPNSSGTGSSNQTGHGINYIVPSIQQPSNLTCWATAATMLLSWRDHRSYSIEAALGMAGGLFLNMFLGNQGLQGNDKEAFLSSLGLKGELPMSYTISGLREMLQNYGPLWVTTVESAGIHARVITGMNGNNLMVNDPADGRQHVESFRTFMNKFQEVSNTGQPGDLRRQPGDFRLQIVHF